MVYLEHLVGGNRKIPKYVYFLVSNIWFVQVSVKWLTRLTLESVGPGFNLECWL